VAHAEPLEFGAVGLQHGDNGVPVHKA
jgi:hypothetical protein